jgi:hypothetical protein
LRDVMGMKLREDWEGRGMSEKAEGFELEN